MRDITVSRAAVIWCAVCAALCLTGPADADRVWVVTQAFDSAGNVARSTLNVVVPEFGAAVPESVRLPGDEIAALASTADGEQFIAGSTDWWTAAPVMSAASTHPPYATSLYELSPAVPQQIGNLIVTEAVLGAAAEPVVVVPRTFIDDSGFQPVITGDLVLLPVRGDQVGPTYPGENPVLIPFEAGAAGLASIDRYLYNAAVVLMWRSAAELSVAEINLDAGTMVNWPVLLDSANPDRSPVSIQKLPGRDVYVAINRARDPVTSEPITEVWVVSFETGPGVLLNPGGQPFVLSGWPDVPVASDGAADLSPDGSGALIATRDETSQTGYIGILDVVNMQMYISSAYPGIKDNFIIRLLPGAVRVLIGADNMLMVASFGAGGEVIESEHVLFQTIHDIAISSDGVTAYVASGSEVYLYDAIAAQFAQPAIALPTGVATALGVLPQVAAAPDTDSDGLSDLDEISLYFTDSLDPDTDDDGIGDGVDISPYIPSPALELGTRHVTMYAVEGRANPPARSVRVMNGGAGELMWTAYVTDAAWIDVQPPAGVAPQAVIISVDAAGLPASDLPYVGHVVVAGAGGDVSDSPQSIEVTLYVEDVPERTAAYFLAEASGDRAPRSIMNGLTSEGYALFGNELLDPVNGFASELDEIELVEFALGELYEWYLTEPIELWPFDVLRPVVVTGNSILGGWWSELEPVEPVDPLEPIEPVYEYQYRLGLEERAMLDEYVRGGGSLLIILTGSVSNDPLGDDDEFGINEWLAPMGIQCVPGVTYTFSELDPGSNPLSEFAEHPVTEDVIQVEVNRSSALTVTGDATALAWLDAEQGYAAMAATFYGEGRVFVMADDYAFTNARWGHASHRQFALNLFEWLSPGGAADPDTDGDGLLDRIEDADGDGAVGPGETDPFNPDSDNDLLLDGQEDLNGNGMVDEGETDPTSADTDGDGLTDGTDQFPLTWPKPFVSTVTPTTGSTIGGDAVTIDGRYLPDDATVLFGTVPSPSVTVISTEQIVASSPPGTGGTTVSVTVIDNSTAISASLPGAFTYLMAPRVVLDIEKVVTNPGDLVEVPVTSANLDGALPATVEMTVGFDTVRLELIDVVIGSAAEAAGKVVEWDVNQQDETVHLAVYSPVQGPGEDDTTISSGELVRLGFLVADYTRRGTRIPLTCKGALASDAGPEPKPIETTCDDGVVVLAINADVNSDGFINAADLQLVINGALGLEVPTAADVDQDGFIDAIDVQKMINALLGIDIVVAT